MYDNYVAIFDLDNTLWTHVPYEIQIIDMASYMKIPHSEELTHQANKYWKSDILKEICISKAGVALAMEENIPCLKAHGISGTKFLEAMSFTDKVTLNDGVVELLEYLKSCNCIIIAYTDWFLDEQESLMNRFGIRKYFEKIYSWDGTYQKPNKERIESVVSNYPNKRFIYIGDNLDKDMKSASYIKDCISIWYNKEYTDNSLNIDYYTSNFKDIIKYLKSLEN